MPLNINKNYRLQPDQYNNIETAKTGICIHHTVGGSAVSTFNWWAQDPRKVATAYIIERDGTILEVFDPKYWAFQFGLKSSDQWNNEERYAFEKRFIGIELSSEGGLIENNGNLYCFDRISPKTLKPKKESYDNETNYRGYRYFDNYEKAQVDSLISLMNDLFLRFNIEKNVPKDKFDYYGKLNKFNGVIGHTMVRKDKSDPAPIKEFWNRIILECGLNEIELNEQEVNMHVNNEIDKDKLFEDNIQQINKMDVASGSMIKQVILELEQENTFIQLSNAVENGHSVNYNVLEGKKELIYDFANFLGFAKVTDNLMEVINA